MENLQIFEKDGLFGFMKNGKVVIEPKYDWAFSFYKNLASVKKGNKWGFINKSNEIIIPFQYDYVDYFNDGLAYVEKDGKAFYINKQGEFVKDA